jgi:hypothetical protein
MKNLAAANSAPGRPFVRHTNETLMRGAGAVKIPLSLTLIAISIVLPEELSFYIFGLRLTAARLLFIVLAPLIVIRLSQRIAAGRYHFLISDFFVVLSGFWLVYAPANILGFTDALNHAGPIALEFCIGYLATRVLLTEHGQALEFINLFCLLIAVMGLLAVLDSLTNRFVIHELASAITGYHKSWQIDYRFGLLRAAGPFEHPIFLGMLSAIGLIIASFVDIRSRRMTIVGCSIGVIFAFSSGPYQCVLIGFSLLTYNRILNGLSSRWYILLGISSIALTSLYLSGLSPIRLVIQYLIYDPESGYYRYWTWQMVSAAVEQSPLYGLGPGPYPDYLEINHTIDSLWLVLSLWHGLPGAILVGISLIAATALPVCSPRFQLSPMERKLGVALGVIIFIILFTAIETDFWGSTWIASAVLTGVKAHLSELGRNAPQLPMRAAIPGSRSHSLLKVRG